MRRNFYRRMNRMNTRRLFFWFGIFLILDGILSYFFGNACLIRCANNNDFGNMIRIIRTIIGIILVYYNQNG